MVCAPARDAARGPPCRPGGGSRPGHPHLPDFPTVWHFDDKVAQKYLLEAAALPIPRTWIFWKRDQALAFSRTGSYPLIIKLAGGIVSENVKLVADDDRKH